MKLFSKCVAIGAIALVSSACSTIKTDELSSDESAMLKEKTLTFSRYNMLPDFPAQTALNVQFGLLGVAAANSNGNAMIRNNQIEDPALEISRQLAEGLRVNHNIRVVEEAELYAGSREIADLVGTYSQYDYLLDVKTLGWSSIYFPTDWDNYRVMYTAHARLIDVRSKKVIAEQLCKSIPEYEDTNKAPTYEELENGSGLNSALGKSIEFCVEHIRATAKLHNKEVETLAENQ